MHHVVSDGSRELTFLRKIRGGLINTIREKSRARRDPGGHTLLEKAVQVDNHPEESIASFSEEKAVWRSQVREW